MELSQCEVKSRDCFDEQSRNLLPLDSPNAKGAYQNCKSVVKKADKETFIYYCQNYCIP